MSPPRLRFEAPSRHRRKSSYRWAMHLAEIPQLKTASAAQKLELIDELWASIPPDSLSTPASHVAALDQRLADLRNQPEKALHPDEARARIRKITGQ